MTAMMTERLRQQVDTGVFESSRSERHHFGFSGFGFLQRDVNVFVVGAHVVGQPGNRQRVSWRETKRETKLSTVRKTLVLTRRMK